MIGILGKLKSKHNDVVSYRLPLGENSIELNELVGERIRLRFTQNIFCIATAKKIKKTYGQGYSWEAFTTLPECDTCIVRPELCHYKYGSCRDPKWGEEHCLKPHVIYLANTGQLKVGITRKANTPTRWIDQGASFALPILEVTERRTSGLIEAELAKKVGDKTNWRKMLRNELDEVNLTEVRDQLFAEFDELFEQHQARKLESEVLEFNYPHVQFPEKISSLNLDKTPIIDSKLLAIKGQYLVFESGALNIRRHQGYEVEFQY